MYRLRLKVLFIIISFALGVLLLRLFQLQVLRSSQYRREAREQILTEEILGTVRGDIVDRNGRLLATEKSGFDICVKLIEFAREGDNRGWRGDCWRRVRRRPKEELGNLIRRIVEDEGWLSDMSAKLGISASGGNPVDGLKERIRLIERDILSQTERRPAFETWMIVWREIRKPHPVITGVSRRRAFVVESRPYDFPGIVVEPRKERRYPRGECGSNIVGYMAAVNAGEYERYRKSYHGNKRKRFFVDDTIGRTGIEKYYDYRLRGERGIRHSIVNSKGHVQEVLEEELPHPGEDVRLTIDVRIERHAEICLDQAVNKLGARGGAAVVLDCRTGEVLALATAPRINSERFGDQYKHYLEDPGRPLINRPVSGLYPTGSVFKAVVATAGLESGILSPEKRYLCEGKIELPGIVFRCYTAHGTLDLNEAIAHSCNVYFYKAGRDIGARRIAEYARLYGFGRQSGIDLPGESRGSVPFVTMKPRAWSLGNTFNFSIGQGDLTATPVQVARMMAAIANGGMLFRPHLVKEGDNDFLERRLELKDSTLGALRKALRSVVRYGTARKTVKSAVVDISGKTGTAERGGIRKDDGWFAGFAPSDDPKIAFSVVIEGIPRGSSGGDTAGPVARRIVEEIFSKNLVN